MDRRNFNRRSLILGVSALSTGCTTAGVTTDGDVRRDTYREPSIDLPIRKFDVVVAGGGTAGVVASLAAGYQGAKTMLIERKGYTGGTITEGGTALHSFFNLWQAFGVKKRQVVQGIPQKIIDRLMAVDGCTGHAEMVKGYSYDSVCTAVDTELYKLVSMQMLEEAGVFMAVNTLWSAPLWKATELWA